MDKTRIEIIGVKPSGILAKWRYVYVVVDEDGLITNENVPGKEIVNQPRISDYAHNDRIYNNGQLITDFCNVDTFTHFYVYAQDEFPFAYTTATINAPECGYLAPLPAPSVPFSPFNKPVYGSFKTFSLCDIEGVPIDILIEKKNYSGSSSFIELGEKDIVMLNYKEVEQKFEVFRPLECVLRFIQRGEFKISDFYSDDERTFRVTVSKGGNIKFKGYIIPDSCTEEFKYENYVVSLRATDGLGQLKTITYPIPLGQTFDVRQSFVDILCYCFAGTNTNLKISTVANLYEVSMLTSLSDDPMKQASINPLVLTDEKGKTLSCYDVLMAVATSWGAMIYQSNGIWNFVRYSELGSSDLRRRNYDYTGRFINAELINTKRIVGGAI